MLTRRRRPVDALTSFETAACGGPASSTTRYAIRQALDQEYRKIVVGHRPIMGQTRPGAGSNMPSNKLARIPKLDVPKSDRGKGSGRINAPKRDFFGRIVKDDEYVLERANGRRQSMNPIDRAHGEKRAGQIFVSFHEGYSNAVRKPITLDDLMRGL